MGLEAVYTEVILDHNRSGHNKHPVEGATTAERGHNPNCGDDLTLMLRVENGHVAEAGFSGQGCAISQASVSIMIDLVTGLPAAEARKLAERFFRMIRGETLKDDELESLGDAALLAPLSDMPARIKCGTLGWHCLEVCLDKEM